MRLLLAFVFAVGILLPISAHAEVPGNLPVVPLPGNRPVAGAPGMVPGAAPIAGPHGAPGMVPGARPMGPMAPGMGPMGGPMGMGRPCGGQFRGGCFRRCGRRFAGCGRRGFGFGFSLSVGFGFGGRRRCC